MLRDECKCVNVCRASDEGENKKKGSTFYLCGDMVSRVQVTFLNCGESTQGATLSNHANVSKSMVPSLVCEQREWTRVDKSGENQMILGRVVPSW